ncbi:MAG TPA: hypothetical protein VN628_18185 [Vicinamibacterales bacterium]|nr:hypothetical protein [Vicinamibacterales bacterium]
MPVTTAADVHPARVQRGRRWKFAVAAALIGLALAVGALLGLDLYAHHRFERGVLVNVWGYRGPAIGHKRPDEYRVAVFGGSAAYGFGVKWEESMPALLEAKLAGRGRPITVVNLAYNAEGAYSFPFTMDDYAYLDYDMTVFYEGYNDLFGDPSRPQQQVFRHESPIFRLTGYLPIFPLVAREKASVMLYGDTREVYTNAHHANTVFTPGLATKAGAELLRSAAAVGESLERQIGKTIASAPAAAPVPGDASGCSGTWAPYCRLMYTAVSKARAMHKDVLVVTQPYLLGTQVRSAHMAQQRELAGMLARVFGGDTHVQYVNLGESVDVSDPELSFDRMHLTMIGNDRIAAGLVAPVAAMAARRQK